MARRPPMKIAPSPSETPLNMMRWRERERSSEAVQAKMREERTGVRCLRLNRHPSKTIRTAKPKWISLRQIPRQKSQKPHQKPPRNPKTCKHLQRRRQPHRNRMRQRPVWEQRISVGVPVSLATSKALEKAAIKLRARTQITSSAPCCRKARAAILKRAGRKTTSRPRPNP